MLGKIKSRRKWEPHSSPLTETSPGEARQIATGMSRSVCMFNIEFDRHNASYTEGEEIAGAVVMDLREDVPIEKVQLEFTGIAQVRWDRRSKLFTKGLSLPKLKSEDDHAIDEERYLNQTLCLYQRAEEGTILAAGAHRYPFSVVVPLQLPSTFSAEMGTVSYCACATIEHPWQTTSQTMREFTITSSLDLNSLPYNLLTPLFESCTHEPKTRLLCLRSGSITATWRLDRAAYVPGEIMRINGEVENNTRFKVKRTTAMLIQHIRFHDGSGNALHERKQVAMLKKGSVQPGHIEFWREHLTVPDLPPTGLKSCKIIELWYSLKLRIYSSFASDPIETSCDIVIGTIPANTLPTCAGFSMPISDIGCYSQRGFSDSSAAWYDAASIANGTTTLVSSTDNLALDLNYFM